jgi:DNA primase
VKFPQAFIDKVRDSNDVVDIIGQFVSLTRAGASFRGLCPFPDHLEKTPSFFVSDVKQLYHCFGCKKSGSAYNFLMDFQGMTFPDAVEYLANRAHISLPTPQVLPVGSGQSSTDTNYDNEGKKTFFKVNKYAASYFKQALTRAPDTHPIKIYIKERGILPETIEEFKIGYSTSNWSDLSDTFKRVKAPLETAEKLGLIKKKAGGGHFDLFRDRLIFPIISPNGNVLGFGGRVLDKDQQPKYLNSPESPIFSKGRTLYGLHVTAKHIRAQNEAYVVEGYMDLLALYKAGIKNVVASLGTAFTFDHASALHKLCSKVVVLFDGDDAGQAAADKSLAVFLEAGLFSKQLMLPDGLDPDDFLKKEGIEEFKRLASEAPDHLLSFMNRQIMNFRGQPSEKIEVLNKVGPLLERVRDQRLESLYLQELGDRLDLEPLWIKKQLNISKAQTSVITNKTTNIPDVEKLHNEESVLVQFMLQKPEYLTSIRESGAIDMFTNVGARELAKKLIEKYCQIPNDFDKLGASLLGQGETNELLTSQIAFRTTVGDLDEAGEKQLILDCLARVKVRHLREQSRKLLSSIKSESDLNSENLEVFMKIAKEQKGLKSP